MRNLENAIAIEYFALQAVEAKTQWKFAGYNASSWGGLNYAVDGLFTINNKEIPAEVFIANQSSQQKFDRIYNNLYSFTNSYSSDYEKTIVPLI